MTDDDRRELDDLRRRKRVALASLCVSNERRVTELVAITAVCGRIAERFSTPPSPELPLAAEAG